ncbi:hypothetical protein GL218_02451 [Daldinia childiae]|uniref:uncharacterized protein n=1 Tax=Daldinia childiae TaxID=326645 RepID=UPI0014487640|nr:uncharacterized protein GL218_02451 [Daldinia childiae]KAF3064313.1 hypothetical protein GL218_02451 [Daldinia childiae]
MTDPTPNKNRLAALSTPRALATPNRRAISAEPSSLRLSASGRRNPNTPHARAAIRAIDQRRAALFTPGRVGRRRSVARERERETPRDLLRNLSRVLAPTSTVVSSSSSSPRRGNESTLQTLLEEGDDDDDFPIERPRFSLPLDRDDDDDSELKPPRSSILDDENYTMQSIELPRRAWTEAPLGRLDRSSLGSARMSDFVGPEIGDDYDNDVGIDSGFFPPPALDDDTGGIGLDEDAIFERVDEEIRRQTMGGQDDFGPIEIPDLGNESTFVMAPMESPTRDPTMVEDVQTSDLPGFDHYDDDDDGPGDLMDAPGLDDVDDVDDVDDTEPLQDTIISQVVNHPAQRNIGRRKPGKKISRHGIEYPSLPVGVVKRLATTLAKTAGVSKAKLSSDTVDAIMQATDWYFEQLGDDLSAYARHAGRKTIDESDMMMLMRRQRQTSTSTTPFSLAQRYLPRELLQEMRMSVPAPTKAPRKRQVRQGGVDEEEEVT